MRAFKAEVIEVIGELVDELESAQSHITGHALEHISPQCVVLTSGGSEVVEAFLREANRKRKFQCVVAEGARLVASCADGVCGYVDVCIAEAADASADAWHIQFC